MNAWWLPHSMLHNLDPTWTVNAMFCICSIIFHQALAIVALHKQHLEETWSQLLANFVISFLHFTQGDNIGNAWCHQSFFATLIDVVFVMLEHVPLFGQIGFIRFSQQRGITLMVICICDSVRNFAGQPASRPPTWRLASWWIQIQTAVSLWLTMMIDCLLQLSLV